MVNFPLSMSPQKIKAVVLKFFGHRTPWHSEKLQRTSKSFCLCGSWLSLFTVLEIKPKKKCKYLSHFKIAIISLLHISMNTLFIKSTYFFQKKKFRRVAWFYIPANLNVWLKKRWLDSYICFCIKSVMLFWLMYIEGKLISHRSIIF